MSAFARVLGAARALDRRVSGWGYEVSGWAGLFVGAVAALLSQEVMEGVTLPDPAGSLAGAALLLVLSYLGLWLAAVYRRRRGGPSCRAPTRDA